MGQGNSCTLYVQALKGMLHTRGVKVGQTQLERFFHFIEEACPWFPEEGTINLETWQKIGKKIQEHYEANGPEKTPVDAIALWNLFGDCLDSRHEWIRFNQSIRETEQGPDERRPAPKAYAAAREELRKLIKSEPTGLDIKKDSDGSDTEEKIYNEPTKDRLTHVESLLK